MLVQKYFESRQKLLEERLVEYLTPSQQQPAHLFEAMRYSVFSGGKRWRPILLLAAYEMMKGRKNLSITSPAVPAACAIELVHCASLVHDDLPSLDNSDERRGVQSTHKQYDPATAILVGDALLTKAFEVLTDIADPVKSVACVRTLSRAVSTRGMIGGQTVDLLSAKKSVRINVIRYIHMKKTGSLLQAATDMACILYEADENMMIMLGNYAMNLGLAYQIIDDILDEVGAFELLGKEPGDDYRSGNRMTYSGLLGLDKAKKTAEKLLDDSFRMVKNIENNELLMEFITMVKDRLP